MTDEVNQISCWRKHTSWNSSDTVIIDELRLTDKQKQAIRNGHKIVNGHWEFKPITKSQWL